MAENGETIEPKPRKVSPINGQPVPNGRPKGVPNKNTIQFREGLINLFNYAAPDMVKWLEQIEDPARRFDVLAKFGDYIFPKLSRQTVVDESDKPQQVNIVFEVTKKQDE